MLVQAKRDKRAAQKLMRKLLRKQGSAPDVATTDGLRSYGAAFAELGLAARHERGLRKNNRAGPCCMDPKMRQGNSLISSKAC